MNCQLLSLHPVALRPCAQAGGELLTYLGLPCIHAAAQTVLKAGHPSSASSACLLHLTPYLPLALRRHPPPKCVCADGPIFPHPQTGDVIRGNLICLECSGDGRKLFCSNICKCIHHRVPGNPSLWADDFVIFMKVWLKVLSNDQPNFPFRSSNCAPREKEGRRIGASHLLSHPFWEWILLNPG